MNDELPILPVPAAVPASFPASAPEPERFPFWGYADVFLIAGLALPCLGAGWGVMRLAMALGHFHLALGVEAVPEMLIGYGLLFAALTVIFRIQYQRPLWRSLGWTGTELPLIWVNWSVIGGFATLLIVGILGVMLRTPPSSGPIVDMMKDRSSLVLLAIFGTTVAPLCEELAFRGFLQPLLVRDLGTIGGILLAAALFGGLHYSEYGDSWRSAMLVGVAGAAFGCMRQWTGSTTAAVIMHASFNGLQFALIFAPGAGGR